MWYDDFVLQLELDSQARLRARVVRSPAGEGTGFLELQALEEVAAWRQPENAAAVRGTPATPNRNLMPPELPAWSAEEVGEELFRQLFSGAIRSLLDHSLGTLGSTPDRGLRIKLKIDPTEPRLALVAALPWELMRRGETADFLGLNRLSPIVRYLDVPQPVLPRTLPGRLRVLAALAQPEGLPALDLAAESHRLEELNGGRSRVEVEVLAHATVQRVRQRLAEGGFHVLHFMGHGEFLAGSSEGVLFFESESGIPTAISGTNLATKLKDLRSLGLVFLNACNSARVTRAEGSPWSGVANALVLGGLPAVLAMQAPVSDQAAIRFSEALYRRLAQGDSLDEALTEGRQAIHSADPNGSEWATPVLFMRVPDGQLFRARERFNRRHWQRAGLGLATAATLSMPMLLVPSWRAAVFGSLKETTSDRLSFEIGQAFSSLENNVNGRLVRIELLADGRMRLHFELRGEKATALAFESKSTYLADEEGRRYQVLAAGHSTLLSPDRGDGQNGEVVAERWLEFPSPIAGTRKLHVELASATAGVSFASFEAELPSVPAEYTRPVPEPEPMPTDSEALVLEPTRWASDIAGFEGGLERVVLLPAGVMRWQLALHNRSTGHQSFNLRFANTYLEDEFGNRYPVLATSAGAEALRSRQAYKTVLERWLKNELWLDFALPQNGARGFKLVFGHEPGKGAKFGAVKLGLPELPERFRRPRLSQPTNRPTPKPAAENPPPAEPSPITESVSPPPAQAPEIAQALLSSATDLATSYALLRAEVTTFARLDNGGLRVEVALANSSAETLLVGLDLSGIYLSDGLSPPFRTVRSSFGAVSATGGRSVELAVAPGSQAAFWLEFPAPKQGAESVRLLLASTDPKKVRFRPLELKLSRP